MAAHNELGKQGEELAKAYLAGRAYRILEQNWRSRHLEIDLIAVDKDTLVFIEVRTRSSDYHEAPEESVSKTKQNYLINAAEAYIYQRNIDLEARFDIVSVVIGSKGPMIHHIEEAFAPGPY